MLDSTFELISLAASNSLVAFCFCNLIIAILLVGNSKPNPRNEERPKVVSSTVNDDASSNNSISSCETVGTLVEAEGLSSVTITMVNNEDDGPDLEEEEDDENDDNDGDNDDLKRRAEEFIEKINKGWRAEKVKAYPLVQ